MGKIREFTDKIDGEEGSEGYVQNEFFDKYEDEMVANEIIANRILHPTPSSQVRVPPQPEPIHHSVRKLTALERPFAATFNNGDPGGKHSEQPLTTILNWKTLSRWRFWASFK